MAYINIRTEVCPMVYDQILAMANPETGVAQVKATELPALMNCHKYTRVQLSKAIQYLIADRKLEFVADNGGNGMKVRVMELCKGNTVTKHIEVPKKAPEPIPTKVEEAPKAEISKKERMPEVDISSLQMALADAEYVLSECPELIGKIFSQFLKTRSALTNLVEEVKKNG